MRLPAIACAMLVVLGVGGCAETRPGGYQPRDPATSSRGQAWKVGDQIDTTAFIEDLTATMRAAGGAAMTTTTADYKATGNVRFEGDVANFHVSFTADGSMLEVIAIDEVVFVRGLPDQRTPWVWIDPDATDAVSRLFTPLADPATRNPVRAAQSLLRPTARVASVDRSTGASTVEISFDPGARSPAGSGGASVAMTTMTYVLDRSGRPTSITVTSGPASSTTTYAQWGVKKSVARPAQAETSQLVVDQS